MKILHLAIRLAPSVCVAALLTAGAQAVEPLASSAKPSARPHRVVPPPKPIVVTEIMPGIPEHEKSVTEKGKGKPRGFDARRHRLPNGNYKRD